MQDVNAIPVLIDLYLSSIESNLININNEMERKNIDFEIFVDHLVSYNYEDNDTEGNAYAYLELTRNYERIQFIKSAMNDIKRLKVIPPYKGLTHQLIFEYFKKIIVENNNILYPEFVVGVSCNSPTLSSLGVLAMDVCSVEAQASLMGYPIIMKIPEVIGVQVIGSTSNKVTSTDIALSACKLFSNINISSKVIEFFGKGLDNLSIYDRSMISTFLYKLGCLTTVFSMDECAFNYLSETNCDNLSVIKEYYTTNKLVRNDETDIKIVWSDTELIFDLTHVIQLLSSYQLNYTIYPLGNAHCYIRNTIKYSLSKTKSLNSSLSIKANAGESITDDFKKQNGTIFRAIITSCENVTDLKSVVKAGLVARASLKYNLHCSTDVECIFSVSSPYIQEILVQTKLIEDFKKIGYKIMGATCQTSSNYYQLLETRNVEYDGTDWCVTIATGSCIFQNGSTSFIDKYFLASPELVVLYSLIGNILVDVNEYSFKISNNQKVTVNHLKVSPAEINEFLANYPLKEIHKNVYSNIYKADTNWLSIKSTRLREFNWHVSTYIQKPEYKYEFLNKNSKKRDVNTLCLLNLGDNISTDHISPASEIPINSIASAYLQLKGVSTRDLNTFAARRGNYEVMLRGMFQNTELKNEMVATNGPYTYNLLLNQEMNIYETAMMYLTKNYSSIILAGENYGLGINRDWAAKGTKLLGVICVIAVSYDIKHCKNLIKTGVIPLRFLKGETADILGLDPLSQLYLIHLDELGINSTVTIEVKTMQSFPQFSFKAISCIETESELKYINYSGIINSILHNCKE